MDFIAVLRGIFGVLVILLIAFLVSNNKRKINWRLVIIGLTIQLIFAVFIIKGDVLGNYFFLLGWPKLFFKWISSFFVLILNFTTDGAIFIFGDLAKSPGTDGSMGFFFAFQVLPTIIFFATLMSVLYYLGVMQKIVQGMAWVMSKLLGTSGAESLSVSANIFVGQTEAPLMIKPYLKGLTKSELLTIMTGGMATIAGGVMAAYIQMLSQSFGATMGLSITEAQLMFATHLLGASVMAAPASLVLSKIIFPETEVPETKGSVKVAVEKNASNTVEAAAVGASDGLQLALNVGAMLLAFIALIALLNYVLEFIGGFTGLNTILMEHYNKPLNLQMIFGLILQFLALAIGVPSENAIQFGSLFGSKVVLNEFVAYFELSNLIQMKEMVNEKAILMATYALCGFANFSSIAIQIGGISPIAPNQRTALASLGMKAVLAGSLSTLLTATLILGSGLGDFAEKINVIKSIKTEDIPNYPKSTVLGHKGFLHFAELYGKNILVFQGRIHLYEGYNIDQAIIPVYIAKKIGTKYLLLTNAAGGTNPNFKPGDLMLTTGFFSQNIKKELTQILSIPTVEMRSNLQNLPSQEFNEIIAKAALQEKINLKQGNYWFNSGPTYETPAEIKMQCKFGADAVGMSTVHEALYARIYGINVSSISLITNYAAGLSPQKLSHQEVIETADLAKDKFERLVKTIVKLV